MNFNDHSKLKDQHAFLGASKYHWINYDAEKVVDSYVKFMATQKGTILHAFAAQCITLGQKLPKSQIIKIHLISPTYINKFTIFEFVKNQI